MAVTASLSPRSLPQSSTGRFPRQQLAVQARYNMVVFSRAF